MHEVPVGSHRTTQEVKSKPQHTNIIDEAVNRGDRILRAKRGDAAQTLAFLTNMLDTAHGMDKDLFSSGHIAIMNQVLDVRG